MNHFTCTDCPLCQGGGRLHSSPVLGQQPTIFNLGQPLGVAMPAPGADMDEVLDDGPAWPWDI